MAGQEVSGRTRAPVLSVLFWLMLAVVLVPSGIFVWLSYVQLGKNLKQITDPIESKTVSVLEQAGDLGNLADENARLEFLSKARVALERDVVLHRHSRSSSALLTRTWMRFMSLIFGSILVVIGSAFVLAQIDVPRTTGRVSWKDFGLSLQSGSAGLFLVIIGGALISIPNLAGQAISVDDTSTYIEKKVDELTEEKSPIDTTLMPGYPSSENTDGGNT